MKHFRRGRRLFIVREDGVVFETDSDEANEVSSAQIPVYEVREVSPFITWEAIVFYYLIGLFVVAFVAMSVFPRLSLSGFAVVAIGLAALFAIVGLTILLARFALSLVCKLIEGIFFVLPMGVTVSAGAIVKVSQKTSSWLFQNLKFVLYGLATVCIVAMAAKLLASI